MSEGFAIETLKLCLKCFQVKKKHSKKKKKERTLRRNTILLFVVWNLMIAFMHGTIIRTGITCKKIPL